MSKGGISLKLVSVFPVHERTRVLLYSEKRDEFSVGFYHDGLFWDQDGRAFINLGGAGIEFSHWCELPFVPVANCGEWKEGITGRIERDSEVKHVEYKIVVQKE